MESMSGKRGDPVDGFHHEDGKTTKEKSRKYTR